MVVALLQLEIMNENLAEGCEQSERVRQNLHRELQNQHQQLQELKTNDLKRQQETDEILLECKKRREEMEVSRNFWLDLYIILC